MIEFKTLCQEPPYSIFQEKYNEALDAGQRNIEAIAISSFNKESNEVDSRFVNLKFIQNDEFIFFSNYQSPKSIAFKSHSQVGALLYWSSINVQIRIKAKINRTSIEYNNQYFKERSIDKNALAISSKQSQIIESYNDVISQYKNIKDKQDLLRCPEYWGGFSFVPYYFEFWEGHESRLNRRSVYQINDNSWKNFIIQP